MSLVRARKNPITGAIVVADVVLGGTPRHGSADRRSTLKSEILELCRQRLPPPQGAGRDPLRTASLDIGAAGKLAMRQAMRNVIVTGGSRGLGLGIARKLAAPAIA